jgi:citrate synthase
MADKPSKGLADVVAASTALSDIDGQAGRLFYRGYGAELAAGRALGALASSMPPQIAASPGPMEAMRSLVSLASADDPDESSKR